MVAIRGVRTGTCSIAASLGSVPAPRKKADGVNELTRSMSRA
jgi:hypothetical protein